MADKPSPQEFLSNYNAGAYDNLAAPQSGTDKPTPVKSGAPSPQEFLAKYNTGAYDSTAGANPKQNTSFAGDVVTALKRGAEQVPGMITGLADIPVQAITGKPYVSQGAEWLGSKTGFEPGKWAEQAASEYSPKQQAAQHEIENAHGVLNTVGAYATNPRAAIMDIAEMAPSMVVGGMAGKGIQALRLGAGEAAALSGAVKAGEAAGASEAAVAAGKEAANKLARQGAISGGIANGGMMAGMTQAQLEKDPNAMENPRLAALASAAAGVGAGALGVGANLFAHAHGLDTPFAAMATGSVHGLEDAGSYKSMLAHVAKGAFITGVMENMPQMAQAQVWSNIASGNPWYNGLDHAMVSGAVMGALMGGATNAYGAVKGHLNAKNPLAPTDLTVEAAKGGKPAKEAVDTTGWAEGETPFKPDASTPEGAQQIIDYIHRNNGEVPPGYEDIQAPWRNLHAGVNDADAVKAFSALQQEIANKAAIADAANGSVRIPQGANLMEQAVDKPLPFIGEPNSSPLVPGTEAITPRFDERTPYPNIAPHDPYNLPPILGSAIDLIGNTPNKPLNDLSVRTPVIPGTETKVPTISEGLRYPTVEAQKDSLTELPPTLPGADVTGAGTAHTLHDVNVRTPELPEDNMAAVPTLKGGLRYPDVKAHTSDLDAALRDAGLAPSIPGETAMHTAEESRPLPELNKNVIADEPPPAGEAASPVVDAKKIMDDHGFPLKFRTEAKSNAVEQLLTALQGGRIGQEDFASIMGDLKNKRTDASVQKVMDGLDLEPNQGEQNAKQIPEASADNGRSSAQPEVRQKDGNPPVSGEGFQPSGQGVENAKAAGEEGGKPGPVESLSTTQGNTPSGNTVETFKPLADEYNAKLKGGYKVEVVQNIPRREGQSLTTINEGVYSNGKTVYVSADALPHAERAREVIEHELSHMAATKVMKSAEYDRTIEAVKSLDESGNENIRRLAAMVDHDQPKLDPVRRAEEILARSVEDGTYKQSSLLQRLVAKVLDAYRRVGRAMGMDFGKATEQEVWMHMRNAMEGLYKGKENGETTTGNDMNSSTRRFFTPDGQQYHVVENPTRYQAETLLNNYQSGRLRGLRDPNDGTLYIWDANKAIHHDVARELNIPDLTYERMEFDRSDLANMPKGVFSGEEGYGRVIAGRKGDYTVTEDKNMNPAEFKRMFGGEMFSSKVADSPMKDADERAMFNVTHAPDSLKNTIKHTVGTLANMANTRGMLFAAFGGDIRDRYEKILPALRQWYEHAVTSNHIKDFIDDGVKRATVDFHKLSTKESKQAQQFMLDSSMSQKWGFDPTQHNADWKAGFDKSKIDPEMQKRFDAMTDTQKNWVKEVFYTTWQQHEMKREVLTKELTAAHEDSVAQFKESIDAAKDALKTAKANNAAADVITAKERELSDLEANAKHAEKEYKATMKAVNMHLSELDGPYIPLKRPGEYFMVAKSADYRAAEKAATDKSLSKEERKAARESLRAMKSDAKHYYVTDYSGATAQGKATAGAEALKKAYSQFHESNGGSAEAFEREKYFSQNNELPSTLVKRLADSLQSAMTGSDGTLTAENKKRLDYMRRTLNEVWFDSLSDLSARQSERYRENVAGVNPETIFSNFIDNSHKVGSLLSAINDGGKLGHILNELRAQAHNGVDAAGNQLGGDRMLRSQVANEIITRAALNRIYVPLGWQGKAMRASAVWSILTSPRAMIQQMTEPFIVALPVLGAQHGMWRARGELWRAYRDAVMTVKNGADPDFGLDISKFVSSRSGAQQREMEMLGFAGSRNRIDFSHFTQFHDLAENPVSRAVARTAKMFNHAFSMMEAANRIATALSSYRMEFEDRMNKAHEEGRFGAEVEQQVHKEAMEAADDRLRRTHGEFGASTTPRMMMQQQYPNGIPIRVISQFRKFDLMRTSLFVRTVYNAMKGATPEEKLVARKTLAWMLGTYGALAGGMGLPMAGIASTAIDGVLNWNSNEPIDPEAKLAAAIGNKDLAMLILHGIPAAMGVDVSDMLGAGGMGTLVSQDKLNISDRSHLAQMALAMSGPFIGGLVPNAIDSVGYMRQGDIYKGVEGLMPTMPRNAMRSYRFRTEGITTHNGDVVLNPDDISELSKNLTLLGVPSTQLQHRNFMVETQQRYSEYYAARASRLERQYEIARENGDSDAIQGIISEWQDMQQRQIAAGLIPTPISNMYKAPMAQKRREALTVGGVEANRRNINWLRSLES